MNQEGKSAHPAMVQSLTCLSWTASCWSVCRVMLNSLWSRLTTALKRLRNFIPRKEKNIPINKLSVYIRMNIFIIHASKRYLCVWAAVCILQAEGRPSRPSRSEEEGNCACVLRLFVLTSLFGLVAANPKQTIEQETSKLGSRAEFGKNGSHDDSHQ